MSLTRKQAIRNLRELVAHRPQDDQVIQQFCPEDWREYIYPEAVALQKQATSKKEVCFPEEIWLLVRRFLIGKTNLEYLIYALPSATLPSRAGEITTAFRNLTRENYKRRHLYFSPPVDELPEEEQERLSTLEENISTFYNKIYNTKIRRNKDWENDPEIIAELKQVCPLTEDWDEEMNLENIKFWLRNGYEFYCAGKHCGAGLWEKEFTRFSCLEEKCYGLPANFRPICVDCSKYLKECCENCGEPTDEKTWMDYEGNEILYCFDCNARRGKKYEK